MFRLHPLGSRRGIEIREFLLPREVEGFFSCFSSLSLLVVGGWEKEKADPMGSESDGVDLVADCLMLVVLLLQGLVLSNNEHGHPHLHAIWFML